MGWLLALLAGGFLTFNAVVTPDRAASEATKALQHKFPGAQVKVAIEGKRGKDVLNGRFRKIDIELANLTLDELPIETSASIAPAIVRAPGGAIQATTPRAQTEAQLEAVKIEKPKKVQVGRTRDLNIVVRDFKWQALPVERADFHFADVEYDFGALKNQSQFKLVRVGKSSMHLELAPAALTPLVAKRVENVTNPVLKLSDGQISVNGSRNFYGFAAPFELKGRPGFEGSNVILTEPKLLVSGLPVPAIVATPMLKSVNPLYSFDELKDLPFAVKLTKVESRDGKLQVDADLILQN